MDIFLIHDNSDRRFRKLVIKFISSTANVVPRKSRARKVQAVSLRQGLHCG